VSRTHYDDRSKFTPSKPCPVCGGLDAEVEWIEARTSREPPNTWFIPGYLTCRTCRPPEDTP